MISVTATIVSEIVRAQNKAELHQTLQAGIERLGFATYNLSCHKMSNHLFMTEPTLTTWSHEDLAVYDAAQWSERDPLLAYAATDAPPKAWAPSDWQNSSQFKDYGDYLHRIGISGGVTAPLANRPGAISAITTLKFTAEPIVEGIASAIYVIGHAGMMRAEVLGLSQAIRQYDAVDIPRLAELSKEQLEILEWMAKGKSNSDIASITNRSKRVVAYHVSETLRKLGVASRSQAGSVFGSSPIKIYPPMGTQHKN